MSECNYTETLRFQVEYLRKEILSFAMYKSTEYERHGLVDILFRLLIRYANKKKIHQTLVGDERIDLYKRLDSFDWCLEGIRCRSDWLEVDEIESCYLKNISYSIQRI